MLLSIIIPVYNGEKYLNRCLQSVFEIKSEQFEVILIDDGSTDSSAEIYQSYAQKNNRLKAHVQKNKGVSSARNFGLKVAMGKYVTFVDCDDMLSPKYLTLLEILEKEKFDIYAFNYMLCSKESNVVKRNLSEGQNCKLEEFRREILSEASNSTCNNLYRLSIIKENDIEFLDGMRLGEDCIFNIRYMQHCKNVFYLDDALYFYMYENMESAMHKVSVNDLKDYMKLYIELSKAKEKYGEKKIEFKSAYYIQQIFWTLLNSTEIKYNNEVVKIFESSELFQILISEKYKNISLNIAKYFLKLRLYKSKTIKKIVSYLIKMIRKR